MTSSVTLRVYDLSRGMARQLSPSLLGKQIDGIWHTGLLVFGKEYFYGGGIQAIAPEIVVARYGMQPVQQLYLGETHVTRQDLEAFLRTISHRFTAATYDLLRNNCNNFSNEVATFLVGTGIPEHIINLPNEALSTPLGAMLRPMLENLQGGMGAGGAQPFGNPFNDPSLAATSMAETQALNTAASSVTVSSLTRSFTVSSDPALRLDEIVKRIEALNSSHRQLLSGEEINWLHAFARDVVKLQSDLKSGSASGLDTLLVQLWSILIKLLEESAASPFFFPALGVFRVLLLLPSTSAEVIALKHTAFDHLLVVTENEDARLTQAQTILLLSVLVNGFASPAASELVLARAVQFLPYVFRSIVESGGASSHDVRIMSAKLIANCCLAMQVEEELLIMVIIGGCIEVLDRLSREGGATPAATHHIQLTLEGVVVGVGRLLQSFAAARSLSVELGLPEVLQRLHSSPSLFRIRPLVTEVVALI